MDELKVEVVRKIDKMPSWRTRILFASLRSYRYYFWSYAEMRELNEQYHQDLLSYNRFPIEYLSVFRKKEGNEVNSFFRDVRDPDYIKPIMWNINYNLKHLSHIIDLCLEYEVVNDKFKYIEAKDFFEKVHVYMDEQKRNKTLEEPINGKDFSEIHYIEVKDCFPMKREHIRWYEDGLRVEDRYILGDEEWDIIDIESDIIIHGIKIDFKNKDEIVLTQKEKKFLKNQLSDLDDITLKTCTNLISNYKLFVGEKKYKYFEKAIRKNAAHFDSLFEESAVEIIVNILRKFYSPAVYFLGRDTLKEIEEKEILDKVFFELNYSFNDPYMLFWLMDLISYSYKKGFYFLSDFGFNNINWVMRQIIKDSRPTWYCFDPLKAGQWIDMEKGQPRELVKVDFDFVKVIKGILTDSFYGHLNSGFILDIFEISLKTTDFYEVTQMIDKAIRKYKKDIKEGKRTF